LLWHELRHEDVSYAGSMDSNFDTYEGEYERFQWDVHILIEGTLYAGIRFLHKEADSEALATNDVQERFLVFATYEVQERFLRNMALVALASRLTHSLRTMARWAEAFSPRKKRYGQKGMSEFTRLWVEYKERFGIDFDDKASRIAFVETLREVRNQIVHDGSEANTLKPLDEADPSGGDSGWLDTRFSRKYPEYVNGKGSGAEVSVSQELLDKNIVASLELVAWLAGELRRRAQFQDGESIR
jgi:hypothetical protein